MKFAIFASVFAATFAQSTASASPSGTCQDKVLQQYKLIYSDPKFVITGIQFTGVGARFEGYELAIKETDVPGSPVFKIVSIVTQATCEVSDQIVAP